MRTKSLVSIPENLQKQDTKKSGLDGGSFERLSTFSAATFDKEQSMVAADFVNLYNSSKRKDRHIPTTVTVISNHTPKSDVEKSYKWVPNPSEFSSITQKVRITEMNNLKTFLAKIQPIFIEPEIKGIMKKATTLNQKNKKNRQMTDTDSESELSR